MLHNFYFSITLLLVLFVPSTQAFASDTVRVFILAGQSNMVGAGEVESNPSRNGRKRLAPMAHRKLFYQR